MGEGRLGGTAYEIAGPEIAEGAAPVVLVHGLGLNRAMWDWQWPALTARFRVLRYDLIGHGESDPPRGTPTMAMLVAQLAELIRAFDLAPCALVGFSLGGMIGRAFALAHPQSLSALAILASAHDRTTEQRAAVRARVKQATRDGPGATVDDALQRWFTPAFAAAHPEVLARVRAWVLANDPAVYPGLYRILAEGDAPLAQAIAAITLPTLVVAFGDDAGNSPEMAQAMAARMPNARAEILPGLRHMGLAEAPEVFNRALISFLDEALKGGKAHGSK